MYSGVVERTQIYLSESDVALLDEQARRTGASRSELIRRAVQAQYAAPDAGGRRAALERSAGTWRNRKLTGAEYTEGLRGSLDQRLTELGMR
jgi:hypothetical protein